MSYQDYLEDKFHKRKHTQSGQSDCCSSPIIDDLQICSDCYDSCNDISEQPRMCKGCGDVEIEDEEIVCSDSCWKLYASETFYND